MTITNLTAKVAGMKHKAVKVLAAAALAGGVLTAAAPAAQAQRVFVRVGPRFYRPAPVVVAPPVVVYGGPGYYGHDDWRYRHDDWRFRHDGYRRDWR
jgi:hypothetical protein